MDRLPLPPVFLPGLDEVLTIIGIIGSAVDCIPQSTECQNGVDCCDPCATRDDGIYCGDELFPPGDPNVRYRCSGGQVGGTSACSQGCEDGVCVDPQGGVLPPA